MTVSGAGLDADSVLPAVVIVGAPRSGTNMLRDALCGLPGFGTWPCDEINYIWRHGNAGLEHDELPAELATPRVRRYIRREFGRRADGGGYAVEKTCANSLRVPFVDRVLPEAKFVWIVRDGRDAVPSAERRWHAKLELRYALAKARFIPAIDLPYYAVHHLMSRAHRVRSPDARLGSWGPRLYNMDKLLGSYSLLEVCAIQWRRCVEQARRDLTSLDPRRVHRVRYEDFLADPAGRLEGIAQFVGRSVDTKDLRSAVEHVTPSRPIATRTTLSLEQSERIDPILKPELTAQGYA